MGRSSDIFFDSRLALDVVRVKPGEYAASNANNVLFTTLGSCVAVCLVDQERGVVGMNHFLLPTQSVHSSEPFNRSARYGANAMELLINECMAQGARRKHLVAKLYGGASVLNKVTDIGALNIEFAKNYLKVEGIHIEDFLLGGTEAYRLYLFSPTGRTEVKRLPGMQSLSSAQRDEQFGLQSILPEKHVRSVPELFAEKI
jgi:chemotaxis protein CheD